jgi:hypothetical protein
MTNWRAVLERDLCGPWTEPLRATGHDAHARVLADDTVAQGRAVASERRRADLLVVGRTGARSPCACASASAERSPSGHRAQSSSSCPPRVESVGGRMSDDE